MNTIIIAAAVMSMNHDVIVFSNEFTIHEIL